jgi:hypothetical protein
MKSAIVYLVLVIVIGTCAMMTQASHSMDAKRVLRSIRKVERDIRELSEVLVVGETNEEDWCPQSGARSDVSVDQLLANIAEEKCLDDKLRLLQKYLGSSSEPLTGVQVNKIVPVFQEFIFVQVAVIGMIKPYIGGLRASELVQLLKSVESSGDRIKLLEALKNTVFGVKSHVETIAAAFSASDKQQVSNIIASAVGINCIFGRVDASSVVFVIDVSPSMNEVFDHPSGKQMSRFDYVKVQMEKILRTLEPSQRFNIVAFSTATQTLRNGLIPATPENVEQMIKEVYGLKVGSGTDIIAGAAKAFDIHPDMIYLLSDGVPNHGITRPADMESKITMWNRELRVKKGLRPIPINTISFLLGVPKIYKSDDWEGEKRTAAAVLKTIASASGGVFKLVDDQ